jgi:Mce-associated membrane protein
VAGHADADDAELTPEAGPSSTMGGIQTHADDTEAAADAVDPPAALPLKGALAVSVTALLAVLVLAGWLGFQQYQAHQKQQADERFVTVARQVAVNLTTVDFNQADADVARILDSATGTFLSDFQNRAQPFIEVVKRAKSKSVGTVTDAGLESVDGDHAQVLVALQVRSSNEGTPEGDPRGWRMRLDVQRIGDDVKVANVQFVP